MRILNIQCLVLAFVLVLVSAVCNPVVAQETNKTTESPKSAPVVTTKPETDKPSQPSTESTTDARSPQSAKTSTQQPSPAVSATVKKTPQAQVNASSRPAVSASRTAATSTSPSDPAAAVKQPAKQKKFAVTFDDLKFEMKKIEKFQRAMLTDKINQMHGGKVKLRGYIRPNFKQSGISKFIFVRDNKECCFGPQAAIFDNVLVRLAAGKTINYTVRPVTVEGNFVLKEYRGPDGKVWSLYRMYDAQIVR